MNSFFQALNIVDARPPVPLTPRCGQCGLHAQPSCKSPMMKVYGEGRRKIMVTGEAPGATENEEGIPFCGDAGNVLKRALNECGVDLYRDCWVINSLRCWPGKGNKIPNPKMIEWCRPFTVNDIKALKPEIIILLGANAVKSVIGWLWREDPGGIGPWTGLRVPVQSINAYVCSTWHPSYIMRGENAKDDDESGEEEGGRTGGELRAKLFQRHIAAACRLKKRPWKEIPDNNSKVRVVLDPKEAAVLIDGIMGKPVAWDIETDGIKPDNPALEILACSFSDGETALAFPWVGDARTAALRLLESDTPKIGYNISFESSWLAVKEGIEINNWVWDGMLAAHLLNTTPNTKSLKFQAFATLGVDAWDVGSKPFMNSKGTNHPNRLREMPLEQMLRYCAFDSLYTFLIAKRQMKRFGYTLEQIASGAAI